MSDTIDIKGLSKGAVVAALYNAARPQGLGYIEAIGKSSTMTDEQGASVYEQARGRLDYVGGRSIKTDVSGDAIDSFGFDRDNGHGAAARAIEAIRAKAGS